ncbi:MAG: hydroxymethylbilane synthase [Clostridiales bacterium]|nr:hydroxymethylbilane synthase [Clostridiales bacterium]
MVIASRQSKLALIQAEQVRLALSALHPEISFEIKTYKTTGDMILNVTLDKIGGKGLFVKELESALLRGDADLLVHSFKDMPMETMGEIPVVGVTKRQDERDVLVLPKGQKDWDKTKPVGTSSKRRSLQLKRLYPEIETLPVRGNVITRLQKLDSGEFGALVLAAAGLKRLGLENRISRYFSVEEILPSACQGALALQARRDFDKSLLEGLHDEDTFYISMAERAFVSSLDGGCSSPVAAHAVIENSLIKLRGLYVSPDETKLFYDHIEGEKEKAAELGESLAQRMKEGGCVV